MGITQLFRLVACQPPGISLVYLAALQVTGKEPKLLSPGDDQADAHTTSGRGHTRWAGKHSLYALWPHPW